MRSEGYSSTSSLSIFHSLFFFFNDTATTEIYTLSLHDALPISHRRRPDARAPTGVRDVRTQPRSICDRSSAARSEEHTSELQSRLHLVCRLLLEKKKKNDCVQSVHPGMLYRRHPCVVYTNTTLN